jgi:hypothetical protein
VSEAWAVNASPLILFARIDRLDLIEHLAPAILIPNAVIEEVRAGQRKDRTAATALEWAEKYLVEDIAIAASIEHWDLGLGEAQVIATLRRRFKVGCARRSCCTPLCCRSRCAGHWNARLRPTCKEGRRGPTKEAIMAKPRAPHQVIGNSGHSRRESLIPLGAPLDYVPQVKQSRAA